MLCSAVRTRAGSGSRARRSSAAARCIVRMTVAERAGSTPARCHCQDGVRRHCSGVGGTRIPCGAGPGADSAFQRSSARYARTASIAVTRCSRIATTARSNRFPVAGSRRPGCSCRARTRVCGSSENAAEESKSSHESSWPTQRGAVDSHPSPPGPQASTRTSRSRGFVPVTPAGRVKRALTGRRFHRVVIHTQSSPRIRHVGSSAPRPSTRSVCPRWSGPRGVQRHRAGACSVLAPRVVTSVVMGAMMPPGSDTVRGPALREKTASGVRAGPTSGRGLPTGSADHVADAARVRHGPAVTVTTRTERGSGCR